VYNQFVPGHDSMKELRAVEEAFRGRVRHVSRIQIHWRAVDVHAFCLRDGKRCTRVLVQRPHGLADEAGEHRVVVLQDGQIRTLVDLNGPIPIAEQTDIGFVPHVGKS
jgi:hypothetical protein